MSIIISKKPDCSDMFFLVEVSADIQSVKSQRIDNENLESTRNKKRRIKLIAIDHWKGHRLQIHAISMLFIAYKLHRIFNLIDPKLLKQYLKVRRLFYKRRRTLFNVFYDFLFIPTTTIFTIIT
jgi:hypothetical protein